MDYLLSNGFVGNELEVIGDSFTELPRFIQCNKLSIMNSAVSYIPEDIIYPMEIFIKDTGIKKLPKNLEVKKLFIDNSDDWGEILLPDSSADSRVIIDEKLKWKKFPYEIWPDNLFVFGDIELPEGSLIWIPDNFIVKGDLDLSDNPISELPENLLVYGNLNIEGTNIETLPDSLKVLGDIRADDGFFSPFYDGIIKYKIPDGRIPIWCNGRFIHIPIFGNFEIMERNEKEVRLRKICSRMPMWAEKGNFKGINILFQ